MSNDTSTIHEFHIAIEGEAASITITCTGMDRETAENAATVMFSALQEL